MQEVLDILKQVRRIEIAADRVVDDLFAGQYKSVFRGRGMEFREVREYEPGDDIRLIDWNVTAREGRPYIKRFEEERELTVLFLVDVSASGLFGSIRSKMETAIEIAATLMFSAMKNNDKVGMITFAEEVVRHFVPRKGKANVLHLIRELLSCKTIPGRTNLDTTLEHLSRTQKRRAVVFLLSDFLIPGFAEPLPQGSLGRMSTRTVRRLRPEKDQGWAAEYDRRDLRDRSAFSLLSIAARRHDLIALSIIDPRELEFPNVGLIRLRDAETGEPVELDTGSRKVRDWIRKNKEKEQQRIAQTLQKSGVDQLRIRTDEDFSTALRRFFRMREQRFR